MGATMKMLMLTMLVGVVAAETAPKVLKMAIHKQEPTYEQLVARRIAGYALPTKYSNLEKGSQKFTSFVDNFYMANFTAGTPPKQFQTILDTGSSNLWIVGSDCKSADCNGRENPSIGVRWVKQKYDRSKSSTYKADGRQWSIQYGSGNAGGDLVKDTITFSGLKVDDVTFGDASRIAPVFAYFPMDSIFGLGWPSIAEDGVTPPVQLVLDRLDKPIFTVWLDRHISPAKGQIGGQITFGDFDLENCDAETVYVPLSSLSYWQFPITGFAYGSYVNDKRGEAISDTGTSFILGPTSDVNQIVKISGATFDFNSGLYTIKCSKAKSLPPVIVKVKGKDLAIPAVEHIVDLNLGNGDCALGFDVGFGFSFDWLLGDAFIRSNCNIYDVGQKRIGFAKAHHSEV